MDPAGLGHEVQWEQLDHPCQRWGPAPCPTAPPSWQLSWELAPDGVGKAAARHSLLPLLTQLGSADHPTAQAASRAALKNGQKWGAVNGSVLFALLLLKDFLYILKRQRISDLITWRTKYATFSYVTASYRKAQTFTEPQPSIECICILCLQHRLFLPRSDRIREEFSVTN